MFVDEYQQLSDLIVAGKYPEALALLAELDVMGRKQEVRRIRSFMRILLTHLIKRAAERRTTRSWDDSIEEAVETIREDGDFLAREERDDLLRSAWTWSVRKAASEVEGGKYTARELERVVDRDAILAEALALLDAEDG